MESGEGLKSVTETEIEQWAGQVRDYTGRDSLASFATLVPDAVKRFNCLYVDGEKENRCWVKAHVANRYIVGSEARDRRFIRSCLEALVLQYLTEKGLEVSPRFFGSVFHRDSEGKFTHLIFQQNLNRSGYQELSKLAGRLTFDEMLSVLQRVFEILGMLNEVRFSIPLDELSPPLQEYFRTRMANRDQASFEVRGLAHCDIRPENIFVKFDELHGIKVKLVDFELAKFLSNTSYEQSDFDKTPIAATLAGVHFQQYACLSAFKQYNNRVKHYVNIQTDLFSVGIVMVYLLLQETPGNFLDEDFFDHLKVYLRDFDPGYCAAMGFPHVLEARGSDLNDLYFFCAPFLFGGSEKPLKANIPLLVLFAGFLRSLEESKRYGSKFTQLTGHAPFQALYEQRHESFWGVLLGLRFIEHDRVRELPETVRLLLYDLAISLTAPTIEQRADKSLNPYQNPRQCIDKIRDIRRLHHWLQSDELDINDADFVEQLTHWASEYRRHPGVADSENWPQLLLPLTCSPHFNPEIHQSLIETIADDPVYVNNELVRAIRSGDSMEVPRIRELVGRLRARGELPPSIARNIKQLETILEQS